MIIHHKDISNISIGLKVPLKYSDNYTFIPLKYINDSCCNCIFQTPPLFVPYGINNLENNKKIIDLSFQNKDNDEYVDTFSKNLNKIYRLIKKKYPNHHVNSFLKKTNYDLCMRVKIDHNSKFYDNFRNLIHDIDPFTYGAFIIQLRGLWIHNNDIWFQWYLLQSKTETTVILNEYSFVKDKQVDKQVDNTKYETMIRMGVPKEAVEIKKKMDSVNSVNSVPPPPPLPNFKLQAPVSKIKTSDLLSIVLKKTKPNIKSRMKKQTSSNHFEPPSIEELQITLSRLKKI